MAGAVVPSSGFRPFVAASGLSRTPSAGVVRGRRWQRGAHSDARFQGLMPHARPGQAAYNLKAIGRQVRKDGLGDARTLLGRNPIVIQVRVAIALRVFDERCMDGVRDQFFYSVGQCCLLLSVKPTTAGDGRCHDQAGAQ
jgi:hypothetical protein